MKIRLTITINTIPVRDLVLPMADGYSHWQAVDVADLRDALERPELYGADRIEVAIRAEAD